MTAAARLRLIAGGGAAYVGGVVLTYEYFAPKPPLPNACERCCTFSCLAPNYDKEIEQDERSSGILELRRELTAHAKGKVLEVAGGTGRMLPFYTEKVDELVVGDASEEMLKVGAGKVAKLRAEGGAPGLSKVTLAVLDAGSLPLESSQYDTVVDSFGLCSFEDPQAAMDEMKRCCKPTGSILLLEHGVSSWGLIARWQQHRLNRHVVRWGCYWNRDILSYVEKAGLRVQELRRTNFGTIYYIRCQRPDAPSE